MTEHLVAINSGEKIKPSAQLWSYVNKELYHLDDQATQFTRSKIDQAEFSLWRYRAALPFDEASSAWQDITLGEGATALVNAGLQWPALKFKLEYAMPTSSFKDRGAAVMFTKLHEWGVERVVADSSGNAGTAIAAYAARTNIKCDIFVPESASAGKLIQMKAHGATVHLVPGPRAAATDAAQQFVGESGIFYASHIFNPYFFEGTKTMAYELWEQLGYGIPEHLVLPVGHGTMFLGAYKGFLELFNSGLITRMPVFHAVQAESCSPVSHAFRHVDNPEGARIQSYTCAEGIAIAKPPRLQQILSVLRSTGGDVITVNDEEVFSAKTELAGMGYFVEPTAAAPFAAYQKMKRGLHSNNAMTVVPLCGSGLKSLKT